MCASLQAFTTSVGIKALTYPGLMANWRDGDHHNNDGSDDVNNPVVTRAEFLNFRDENHQFCEKSQKIISEIQQKIATLLARKSSCNNNVRYIQRCTPNYKKIPFFDGDMCKLDFIDWPLDLEEYFNFWKICDEEKVQLLINWMMKQRNGGKRFKSIESGEVSIQSALGKE